MKSSIASAPYAYSPAQQLCDHVVEFALDATLAVEARQTGYLGRFARRRAGSAALGLPPGVLATPRRAAAPRCDDSPRKHSKLEEVR